MIVFRNCFFAGDHGYEQFALRGKRSKRRYAEVMDLTSYYRRIYMVEA